jgi:hypothetical protein
LIHKVVMTNTDRILGPENENSCTCQETDFDSPSRLLSFFRYIFGYGKTGHRYKPTAPPFVNSTLAGTGTRVNAGRQNLEQSFSAIAADRDSESSTRTQPVPARYLSEQSPRCQARPHLPFADFTGRNTVCSPPIFRHHE